jgi:hypothetical protein
VCGSLSLSRHVCVRDAKPQRACGFVMPVCLQCDGYNDKQELQHELFVAEPDDECHRSCRIGMNISIFPSAKPGISWLVGMEGVNNGGMDGDRCDMDSGRFDWPRGGRGK